jgi:cobalt-zinc-cadmium efflux system membrane fusion protein
MIPIRLKMAVMGLLVFVLGTGAMTRSARAEKDDDIPALVPGNDAAIRLPAALAGKLGVKTAEAKSRVAGKPRVLQLNGSTALDPAKVFRVRGRFTPFEVIEIGRPAGAKEDRTLRPGDWVTKGQVLVTVRSQDVAAKKSDLFDAAVQLKLDEAILEQAEKAAGAVPEVFLLNARRNVQAGRNSVNRATNALKSWGIPDGTIAAVRKEAQKAAAPGPETEETVTARLKEWSTVVLSAPADGVIVERNVSAGEMVKDGTTNLFTIANPDRLLVIAIVHEDDLPALNALKDAERRWSVKVPARASVEGTIDDIGLLVDAKTHTAVVKGYIDNKDNRLRAGQFVTASVTLPQVADEVSVPATAVVEEKGQTFVFVQPDAKKPVYEQRRVVVVRRGSDTVHVRTRLTPEEKRGGAQPARPGERVVTAGAIELKALLADLKAD